MSLKAFYAALLSVLATVISLSVAWEFWLEDWLLTGLISHHETETLVQRLEFIATTAFFSLIALIGPAVIGTRIILRERILRQTITRLSQEDPLTGLNNRRRINELLEIEIQRATRYNTMFSVILVDIDHFKDVNDQFGHQIGDEVLTRIAEIIRSSVRATDLTGRWGGEEFVIISPGTEIDGSLSLAEKIRTRLESTALGEIGQKTASFGVTTFSDGDSIEKIIARADIGLYAAKQGGRNRVEKAPVVINTETGSRFRYGLA